MAETASDGTLQIVSTPTIGVPGGSRFQAVATLTVASTVTCRGSFGCKVGLIYRPKSCWVTAQSCFKWQCWIADLHLLVEADKLCEMHLNGRAWAACCRLLPRLRAPPTGPGACRA